MCNKIIRIPKSQSFSALIVGAKNVITRKHLERVKKNCIICNMGHSNQEIDLESLKDLKREKIRRNVTHITMPNGKSVILLAEVHVYICIYLMYMSVFVGCCLTTVFIGKLLANRGV